MESYRYFAFISFQSSNAKEALWVQRAIESYRLPTALSRQDKSLPKRMRPCFCYLNDINLTEELMQELKQRMEQSEYLIVICSPQSARSTFVNGGIDYFVSLGRRDRIIPLIVEGIPYSADPEQECFPEALRRHFPKSSDPMQDHQILGVNINEEGAGSKRWKRKRAVLMVIARMLGLEFQNLWNREVKRQRKRKITIASICLAVLLALTLTWHFSRSVTVGVRLVELTAPCPALPPLTDGMIQVQFQNETKEVAGLDLQSVAQFRNIPRRFIGRTVQLHFSGSDYLPIDTTITLQQTQVLTVQRDEEKYGNVHFYLRGIPSIDKAKVEIQGQTLTPTADGLVQLFLPFELQRVAYSVRVNGMEQQDSIYMPCGEKDIFIVDEVR